MAHLVDAIRLLQFQQPLLPLAPSATVNTAKRALSPLAYSSSGVAPAGTLASLAFAAPRKHLLSFKVTYPFSLLVLCALEIMNLLRELLKLSNFMAPHV